MKWPTFGRKPAFPAPAIDRGHAAMLERLAEEDQRDPMVRLRLAGQALFSGVCRMISSEKGVRIEDVLGILGANGGFACIVGALSVVQNDPSKASGISVATTKDGNQFYFGDLPNRALLEDRLSLLSLTLGTVQQHDASVSMDLAIDVVKHVAATVGTPEFGVPRLPHEHTPGDLPFNYVKYLWPKVRDALDLYEVPAVKRATSIGFAIQEAIDKGTAVLSPKLAAQIIAEYAIPTAKLDPAQFD